MTTIYCEQLSDEWYAARLGKVTASHFGDVLAGKETSRRKTYMLRLLAERMTGQKQDGYSDKNMEWGIETEPQARDYYEWVMDEKVEQVGICFADEVGASPDGLVGDKGLLEIKCPLTTTHLSYIIKNVLPATYKPQVQGQLLITGREWTDFISYDPRYLKQPMWQIRVERDEAYLTKLSAALAVFTTEISEMERKLNEVA